MKVPRNWRRCRAQSAVTHCAVRVGPGGLGAVLCLDGRVVTVAGGGIPAFPFRIPLMSP